MHTWLLPLLRCPCCMSGLALDGAALCCDACARAYPLQRPDTGERAVPWLRRGDDLATLAQDVVVHRYDPDSAPVEARRRVARHERRERFLAPFLHNVARPYAMRAAPSRDPYSVGAPNADTLPAPAGNALLDHFVGLPPPNDPVLVLECVAGEWAEPLAAHGRHVVSVPLTPWPALSTSATAVAWQHTGAAVPGGACGHLSDELGGAVGLARPQSASAAMRPQSQAPFGDIALIDVDMMEMPFAAASMAGVWCGGVFAYVRPDGREVFFRQIHRVLRPGGLLYLDAATQPPSALARQFLLWRVAFGRPVRFGEYIYRLPPAYRSAWHYHAVADARTLRALCGAHGFDVVSLQREGSRWLLLARKRG